MSDARDRVALVTGASSGIGAEIARELARRGHHVTLAARREERLRSLADEIANDLGGQAKVAPVDLADPLARERLIGEIEAWLKARG